jgi:YD repeat-containing protein
VPAVSRLSSASDGTNSAAYYYVANSTLVDHIDFAHNGAFVMRTQNTYDHLSRLISRVSLAPRTNPPGTTPASFQYQYNPAGQRTRATLADGSYWLYGYDGQGQLTNGSKYFLDGTPYAGQQFAYAFDSMGNRLVQVSVLTIDTTLVFLFCMQQVGNASPTAHVQSPRDPLQAHRRFPAQPPRHRHF